MEVLYDAFEIPVPVSQYAIGSMGHQFAIVESLPVDPFLPVGILCTVSPNFLCLGPSSTNKYSLSLEILFSISLEAKIKFFQNFLLQSI